MEHKMVAPIQYVVCYVFLLKKIRESRKRCGHERKYQKAGIKIIRGNKMSWAMVANRACWMLHVHGKKCNIPLFSCEILDHFNYGI